MAAMRRTVLPLAALLAFALALVACGESDDPVDVSGDSSSSSPDDSTGTTEGDETTSSSGPDGPAGGAGSAIWEPATTSTVATDVAVAFATEYLGIAGAQTTDDDRDAGCAADVPVTKGSSATTTVHVAQGEEGCVVIGATSDQIVVDQPGTDDEITSPASVSGQAQAFEGTVVVQVRPRLGTQALGEGFVTGRSDALGPFSGTVDFMSGTEAGGAGAVVFYAPDESGEGTAIYATVVPVTFG
jgi:hypothetical protein